MSDGTQHFIQALRDMGIEPITVNLGGEDDGECPVHSSEPCPDPAEEMKAMGDKVAASMDAADLLRLSKLSLHFAVRRLAEDDTNGLHARLAIADTAMELYDRQLAAEIKAEFDALDDEIIPTMMPGESKETAEEYAARYAKAKADGREDDPEIGL